MTSFPLELTDARFRRVVGLTTESDRIQVAGFALGLGNWFLLDTYTRYETEKMEHKSPYLTAERNGGAPWGRLAFNDAI